VVRACEAVGLKITSFSRRDEAAELKVREGSTLAWGVATAIKGYGAVPDIIYDLGEVGREAMVRVLGHDPLEVARKVIAIRQHLPLP
jgi:hydroxymethylpyrimidine kinase / phosphomethylpyrimidine kinase / thiamine-phosphate diphosphorylase